MEICELEENNLSFLAQSSVQMMWQHVSNDPRVVGLVGHGLWKSWHHLVWSPSLHKRSQGKALPVAGLCTCYCEATGTILFRWVSCIHWLYVYILWKVLSSTRGFHWYYFSDSALPSIRVISGLQTLTSDLEDLSSSPVCSQAGHIISLNFTFLIHWMKELAKNSASQSLMCIQITWRSW